jgi:hypothetical protein
VHGIKAILRSDNGPLMFHSVTGTADFMTMAWLEDGQASGGRPKKNDISTREEAKERRRRLNKINQGFL